MSISPKCGRYNCDYCHTQ